MLGKVAVDVIEPAFDRVVMEEFSVVTEFEDVQEKLVSIDFEDFDRWRARKSMSVVGTGAENFAV
jgi:hypothetical protein